MYPTGWCSMAENGGNCIRTDVSAPSTHLSLLPHLSPSFYTPSRVHTWSPSLSQTESGSALEVSGAITAAPGTKRGVAKGWGASRRQSRAERRAYAVGVSARAAPAPFGRTKASLVRLLDPVHRPHARYQELLRPDGFGGRRLLFLPLLTGDSSRGAASGDGTWRSGADRKVVA